jgi:hypothetical protein
MKTKTFNGKDERDLDQKIWAWRSANPKAVINKTYPVEALPVAVRKPEGKYTPILPGDLVSRKIDYEDSN